MGGNKMARIPMGNFGNAMPQVERIQMPQDQRGQIIANGVKNIGNDVVSVVQDNDEKQRSKEAQEKTLALQAHQQENRLNALKSEVDFSELSTQFDNDMYQVKKDVANGVKTQAIADKEMQDYANTKWSEFEQNLPIAVRDEATLKTKWGMSVAKQRGSLIPLQIQSNEKQEVVLLDRATEVNLNNPDPQNGLKDYVETLKKSNIPMAEKQDRLNDFRNRQDTNAVKLLTDGYTSSSDTTSLETLYKNLDDPKNYQFMKAEQRTSAKASITSRISAIQSKQEVESNKRNNEATKVLNEFKSQVMTGRGLDVDYISNVKKAVAGTEAEQEVLFYEKHSKNIQQFSLKSSSEQAKIISDTEASFKTNKSSDPKTEEQLLAVYKKNHADKLSNLKDNPTQALKDQGIKLPDLIPAELKANPSSFIKSLVEIGSYQTALRDKDANVTIKPIAPDVLPEAKKAFEEKTINQKLNFIGGLVQSTKGIKGGERIWGATLGQLGGGDQSYIMAGIARMNNYRSTAGEDVATAIISGTQALKNKQLLMPKDEVLKQKFNEYVGNTVSGQTANMTYSGFKSIYAHLVESDNYQHKDDKDINEALSNSALSMATGGVYDQGIKFGDQKNKWKVSKPYGMEDSNFQSRLTQGYSNISKNTGIADADLQTLRLRRSEHRSPKGEIQYDLINERGNPLVVGGNIWRINMSGATK